MKTTRLRQGSVDSFATTGRALLTQNFHRTVTDLQVVFLIFKRTTLLLYPPDTHTDLVRPSDYHAQTPGGGKGDLAKCTPSCLNCSVIFLCLWPCEMHTIVPCSVIILCHLPVAKCRTWCRQQTIYYVSGLSRQSTKRNTPHCGAVD